jgi:hypothetical protein
MLNKTLVTSLGALAALMTITLAPAQADGVRSSTCVGGFGGGFGVACVSTWRRGLGDPHIIRVPERTETEQAEIEERDRVWRVRCQPVVRHDSFGVGRYSYASHGCEYGRID